MDYIGKKSLKCSCDLLINLQMNKCYAILSIHDIPLFMIIKKELKDIKDIECIYWSTLDR